MRYLTRWSIFMLTLLTLLLTPKVASSQGTSEAPILPKTVPEATTRFVDHIGRLASDRMISQQEAMQLFLDAWEEGLRDGDPSPSVLTEAQFIALQNLGVSFENVSICEYVILPDNVSWTDYTTTPERYYQDPSCLPYPIN